MKHQKMIKCLQWGVGLAVALLMVGGGLSGAQASAKQVAVGLHAGTTRSTTAPGGVRSKVRIAKYRKQVLWVTKARKVRGRTYCRLTNHHRNLGYVPVSALYPITKPRPKFSPVSVAQGSAFNANKLSWEYYYNKPDKVWATTTSYVNTKQPGNYTVIYHVKDTAGYRFNARRTVQVKTVTLTGMHNPNYQARDEVYQVSAPGETLQLRAKYNTPQIKPAAANRPTWRSTNPSVASVSQTGRVTMHRSGVAQISVRLRGKVATTPVLVTTGSHLGFGNSDQEEAVTYDTYGIYYDPSGDATHTATSVWYTDGNIFMQQNFAAGQTLDDYANSIRLDWETGVGQENGSIILQTVDDGGGHHQYVGHYAE